MADPAYQETPKRPASQYYWGDWRKDEALQSCSLMARGLWHEMNCIMHSCVPYGHLYRNGKPMTTAQIATLVSITVAQCKKLLAELEDAGVPSRDANGAIFSRRMVRDEAIRAARAAGGQAGAEHGVKGAEAGKKGGRPAKSEGGSETPLPPTQEPPPSSSSSSSTSVDPPTPPRGRKPITSLRTWLDGIKAAGEKAIPDSDPVFGYAEGIGLPYEFLHLAWREFLHRYTQPEAKRYRDWRAVFRKAVRGNWLKLWWLDGETYTLTTAGVQAQRAHKEKAA